MDKAVTDSYENTLLQAFSYLLIHAGVGQQYLFNQ